MENIINPTIKSVPNIGIDSLNTLTYDPTSDTVITTTKNKLNILSVNSDSSTSFQIPAPSSLTQEIPKEKSTETAYDRLRFIPANADSKMSVTHFGHVVTNYSKKPQVAKTNYGFSQGVHYWEIICPIKCTGIEVGIVKEKPEKTEEGEDEYIFFEFNTSTARIICIQLDLNNLEISAWLQANEAKKKTQKLTRGRWIPCVRINEIGNTVVLNTRINDTKNLKSTTGALKQYSRNQLKKALSLAVITIDKEASSRSQSPLKPEASTKVQAKKSDVRAYTFSTEQELKQFKANLSTNDFVVEPELVLQWGLAIAKQKKLEESTDLLLKKAQEWLSENLYKVVESYKPTASEIESLASRIASVNEKLAKNERTEAKAEGEVANDIQVQYIKASDSLLIRKGEFLKLVTRVNGEFNMNEIFSFNRPITPKDEIQLFLDLRPLKTLLQKVASIGDFAKKVQNYTGVVGLDKFLEAINASLAEGKIYSGYLLINIAYKYAKRGADVLTSYLENSVNWLRSLLEGKNVTIDGPVSKDTSEDELIFLLNFVSGVDEALHAMIQHEDASSKLFSYYQGANSRTFTSFDRIETLTTLPDLQYDIIKLSDFGLLNRSYLIHDFKHFQNEEVPIDSEIILQNSSTKIEAALKKHIKTSSKNVPLSTTLNNLPPQVQDKKDKDVLVSEETPYVVSISDAGEIKIWDTNKALIFLCQSDFTKAAKKIAPSLFGGKKDKKSSGASAPAATGFGGGGGFGFGGGFGAQPAFVDPNANKFEEPEEFDEEKPDDTSKEPAPATTATAQGFGFGAPATSFGNPFTFGSTGGFGAPATTFGFGTTAPADGFGAAQPKAKKTAKKKKDDKDKEEPTKKEEKTESKTEEKDKKIEAKTEAPTFTFGTPSTNTGFGQAPATGFGFGAPSTGVTFGQTTPAQTEKKEEVTKEESGKEKTEEKDKKTEAKTEGSTFAFGTAPTGTAFGQAPATGFGFGAPSTGVTFGTPSTGTGFGAPSTGTFDKPAPVETEKKEEGKEKTEEKDKEKVGEKSKEEDDMKSPEPTVQPVTNTGGFGFGATATTGFGFGTTAPAFPLGGGNTITYDDYVEDWEDFPPESLNEGQPSTFGAPFGATPFGTTGFGFGQPKPTGAAAKKAEPKAKAEDKIAFDLAGCSVTGNVVVPISNTPLSPLIVGLSFKKEDNCVLRFRRFGYCPTYINKFFYKHPTKGLFSLINNQLFDPKDFEGIQRHLLKEYKLAFSSIEPLVFGRNRYRKTKAERFFSADWIELEDADIKLPFKEVLTLLALPQVAYDGDKEIRKVVAVGQTDSQLEACLIEIKTEGKNPYDINYNKDHSFTAKITVTKTSSDLAAKVAKDVQLFAIRDHILVFQPDQSQLVLLDKELNIVKAHDLGFEVRSVKVLEENKLGILSSKGEFSVFNYEDHEASLGALPEIKKAQSSRDHINTITQTPMQHLDEILNVLQNSAADEKLVDGQHIRVYQGPFSHSIKLEESEQYSRISLELNLVRNVTGQLTEASEKQLRDKLESLRTQANTKGSSSSTEKVQNDFPLFERSSLEPGSLKYLPIIVHQAKGSSFSQVLPAAYMTSPSTEVFASKYANAEFTFRHLHDKSMMIDSITVASPLKPTGLNAYPIESGFIYLIDNLSILANLENPKISTEEEFRAWNQSRVTLDQSVPVGFFRLGDDKETQNFELLEKRPSKFIVLKPVTLRNEGKILSAKDHPVEIGFFGVHGFALQRENALQKIEDNEEASAQTVNVDLKVEVKVGGQWKELQKISSITLNNQRLSDIDLVPVSGTANVNISHEELENGVAKELRVVITSTGKEAWNVFSANIQPVILSKNKDLKLNYDAAVALKNDLVFKNKYQELLESLINSVCSESISLIERKKIAQILHAVLSTGSSLLPFIFNKVDFESYILLNILPEIKNTSFAFLSLLRDLSRAEGFKAKLSQALQNILPKLAQTASITNNGVKTYFTLLYWSSSEVKGLETIIAELKRLCKQVSTSRIPGYKILKSQYNVPALSFEKNLFDESFIIPLIGENEVEKVTSLALPIQLQFLHKNLIEGDEYLIDLKKTYDVSNVKLWFPEQEKISNLRVQIWGITEDNNKENYKLLVSRYYDNPEGVWLHLTKQAHEPSLTKYFLDSEELSTLGFAVNERLRYLQIQVTYSFRAGLPNLNKNLTKKTILPIVNGTVVQGVDGVIEKIAKKFDVKSTAQFKSTEDVNSLLSYEKFDHLDDANTFFFESVGSGDSKETGVFGNNTYDLEIALSGLQGELYNELYKQRNSGSFFQNHDVVYNLCNKIQNLQIRLYNQSSQDEQTKKDAPQSSLTVLLNLIQGISQYILKLTNQNQTLEQKYFTGKDIKEIFDAVLLYESPIYVEQLLKVIEKWIWPSLSAQDKKDTLNAIFQDYLTSSISLIHHPVEKLYSTLPAVDFILRFTIQEPANIKIWLDKLGEVSSLIGNTYALIIINECYLKFGFFQDNSTIAHGDIIEALVRNLHYTIETPEFMETEKQYTVGLIVDILLNVIFVSGPQDIDRLYKEPKELFRVFHYVTKNRLSNIEQKLVRILNVSCETLLEKNQVAAQGESRRIKTLLGNLSDAYVHFFFETLRELIQFAKGQNAGIAKDSAVRYFSEEITETEWKELTRLFLVHLYSVLELDRKERIRQQRAQMKLNKLEGVEEDKEKGEQVDENAVETVKSKLLVQPVEEDKEDEEGDKEDKDKEDKEEKDEKDEKEDKEEKEKSDDEESEDEDDKTKKESKSPKKDKLKTEFSEFLESGVSISKFTLDDSVETDKEIQFLSHIIFDLILLLNRPSTQAKKEFNFSQSHEHWLIILKLFSMFKPAENYSLKVASELAQAFFSATSEIQEYVYPFVTLLFKYSQSFSIDIITQLAIFSAELDGTQREKSSDNVASNNFLSTSFERIKQALKAQEGKSQLPYNEILLIKVITMTTNIFKTFNFGGKKGIKNWDNLPQLQREKNFVSLIETSTKKETEHPLLLVKLLENYNTHKNLIDNFANTLMSWYLFNRNDPTQAANSSVPSGQVLSSFSKKIEEILKVIATNEQATKAALKSLLTCFSDILNVISDLTCKRTITGYVSMTYIKIVCSSLEEILSLLITTNTTADYFARELQGFEYLLKVLGLQEISGAKPSSFFQHNEISEYFTRRFSKFNSEDNFLSDIFQGSNSDLFKGEIIEEEFAKKVSIHRIKGQKWPKLPLDLVVNKTSAQKVLSFRLEGDEYCLCLEFHQFFEIRNVAVGLLDFPEFHTGGHIVIPEMFIEVGPSINDLTYIGKLKEIERTIANQQTFTLSLDGFKKDLPSTSEPEDWLKSTSNLRVKFMKIRFRKPVLNFNERFGLSSTPSFKYLTVNVCFVSVTGINVNVYRNLTDHLKEVPQVSALTIINRISQEFTEAWTKLAEKDFFLEKNDKCLEAISSLMVTNSDLATKIILSFCKYSNSIGSWLFEQILQSPVIKKYSSLISDLIVNEPSHITSRVERLNRFLVEDAKKLNAVKSPEQHTQDFEAFIQFVDILTTTINIVPEENLSKGISLDIAPGIPEILVQLFKKFRGLSVNAIKIIKLIIIYVFCPKPFVSKNTGDIKAFLEFTYSIYQKEGQLDLLQLLALIGIGSSQATKWLSENIQNIFERICEIIKSTSPSQYKSLTPVFVFFNSVITTEAIKKKFLKESWHLELFNLFKSDDNDSPQIFKTSDPEILGYLQTFLKNVTIDYSEQEDELARILKENFMKLSDKPDNAFLQHFFLPLLKAEAEIPVCLYPYDYSKKVWVGDLQLQQGASQTDLEFFSKILKNDNKVLNKMLTKATKKAGTYSKYSSMKWKRLFQSTQDGDPNIQKVFLEKLPNKAPYMVIMEGKQNQGFAFGADPAANNQKAIVGAFVTKPIPTCTNPMNFYQTINKADDSLLFYYNNTKKLHFPMSESSNKSMASINIYTGGGGINFFFNTLSPIYLALAPGQLSYVSMDLLTMKPLEDVEDMKNQILGVNSISNIEIWILEEGSSKKEVKAKNPSIVKSANILRADLFNEFNPLNFYRPMPVYTIPASLLVQQLSKAFFKQSLPLTLKSTQEPLKEEAVLSSVYEFVQKDPQLHGVIDIEFDYNKYLEIKQSGLLASETEKLNYSPNMNIFNVFKRHGGVDNLISVATSNIEKWKKQELKTQWTRWITDLKSLSDFPNFFEAFIKNPEAITLLFEILANKPDEEAQKSEEDAKKWEEKEIVSSKYIYQALADSFKLGGSSVEACELAIESNRFSKILDVLGVISKEKPRKWYDNPEEEEKKEESQTTSPTKKETKEKDEGGDAKPKAKKKGVGYGSDLGGGFGQPKVVQPEWNVNQFVEKKKMKNEQLIALMNVIASIFETKGWEPSQKVLKMICESALLPLLESAFRNGSLVDMGKESNLYFALLRLVKSISIHKTLIPCLLELEKHYRPTQRDSVYSLLSHMNDISKIFISCLSNTDYKKDEDEPEKEKATTTATQPGGFGFGDPFGGQQNTDVSNAIKVLQKPLAHTKMAFGQSTKEFIFQTAMTANNPDLLPQAQLNAFGGFAAKTNNVQAEEKKVEKKPKPSVFNSKVTQEKKAITPAGKTEEETQEKIKKKLAKDEVVSSPSKSIPKKKSKKSKKKTEALAEKDDEALQNERLAHEIIEVFEVVKKEVMIFRANDESRVSIEDILKKPLPEAYRTLLGSLRFDYMDMKENNNKYKHYYGHYSTPSIPPQSKMIRLAQELADLSNSLPNEHTNAIFVRVDKTKVDLMKVMIMGSSGTPYAHGAFEFDVNFDDSYPNTPPKINLMTTGGGQVRFNPNLYANGKVCLSLLGTWSGRGGENWNPKLSTFLQVLLSIQSLIMTEDVYFNEPGLEVYAGTPQGELDNEGYSNVVKYCNIKYAMIEQIRNPPKGFEHVVRRHFYLKKKEILDEVKQWVESSTKNASYTGCQNYNWQALFNQSKTKYSEMITEISKELEEELNKIPVPADLDAEGVEVKRVARKAKQQKLEDEKPAEEIDVTYDKDVKAKDLDVTDDAVKDRWSRYIGAMGIEAVRKQANSSVFLSGLGPLGVEIAKNITLSGVKRFTLHDSKKVVLNELSGQFFLEEEDVGKNRVSASLNKLQQLNFYVKIDTVKLDENLPKEEAELEKIGLKDYNLVIATESDKETLEALDRFCRKRGIAFIAADIYGPFSRIFCDFGDEFVVTDKDGEEAREVLIKSITNEEQGLVTLLETNKHNFEDGDEVIITEVVGMEDNSGKGSINESKHKVKVQNAYNFRIGDTRNFTAYKLNGKVKIVKNPIIVKFKSLEEATKNPSTSLDQNLSFSDFAKCNNSAISHVLFEALEEVRKENGKLPRAWNQEDSTQFARVVENTIKKVGSDVEFNDEAKKLAQLFSFTCSGIFSPLAAFIGGFVAQEAVKALTNKFRPINQFFYSDCTEVVPQTQGALVQKGDRYDGLRVCIGDELFKKLSEMKIFMVGVGAIGCELLKNFAMLGLSTASNGEITITDPDVIETSNLNRQFLFREKHLRKPKSQTAAASIVQMNKDLKGKIHARLDKVHPGTAHIFTDKFFEGVDVVANALDNVQARRYIDMRCVKAKTPLLESGTLGPKGHVQVIVPYKTESYGSQEDPQDEQDIPHCTLKMFPEETLHCVEWARDKFGKLFSQKPKSLVKLLEETDYTPTNMQELETLKHAVKLLKKMPTNFDDCIRYARQKFQKYFVNDIRQLLFTYPLDHKTKQGTPFWASPKRPPTEVTFDANNLLHASFIGACAILWASIFGIPVPNDAFKDSVKLRLAGEAAEVKVKDFKPSGDKAKELATEVELEETKKATPDDVEEKAKEKEEVVEQFVHTNELEVYKKEFQDLVAALPKDMEGRVKSIIFPQEFEKDNDKNFHIEFIYALANCRASNYKLEPMDWMTVKLKAGRIVPALATTTASIAGLQTIELCKVINQNKIEEVKNAFLNFAVPYLTLSEPGPVQKVKLTDKLTVTLWDRWEVPLSRKATLKDLFAQVLKDYELQCLDVMFEGKVVYLHNIMELQGRETEKEKALNKELFNLLDLDDDSEYADLTVTFSKIGDKQILDNTPEVRVKFN